MTTMMMDEYGKDDYEDDEREDDRDDDGDDVNLVDHVLQLLVRHPLTNPSKHRPKLLFYHCLYFYILEFIHVFL